MQMIGEKSSKIGPGGYPRAAVQRYQYKQVVFLVSSHMGPKMFGAAPKIPNCQLSPFS